MNLLSFTKKYLIGVRPISPKIFLVAGRGRVLQQTNNVLVLRQNICHACHAVIKPALPYSKKQHHFLHHVTQQTNRMQGSLFSDFACPIILIYELWCPQRFFSHYSRL